MIATKYSQYTRTWKNLLLDREITNEQREWLNNHKGGDYYIHFSQKAIKFERVKDYEWFVLRWL